MWDLNWILNKKIFLMSIGIVFFFYAGKLSAENTEVKDPSKNMGFLLIQKEIIRKSEIQKEWTPKDETEYRGWLFLEAYFLRKGISIWSMKVLHRIVQMKYNILEPLDDPRKAFLDCEAWRVLDYDLKNNENKELIKELIEKRKFAQADYIFSRKQVSQKVAHCIEYIASNWTWKGPPYEDAPYDVKAKNAIESMKTYIKMKSITFEAETE